LNIYDLDNDYADIIINTDNNLSTYYLNNDNIIYKKMNLYINDIFLDRVLFNKDCDSYHYIISNYHGLEYDGIRDLVELLDNDGKLMLVISKGFLFRSHEEKNIREYLIDNNLIDAIIDIPPEYDKYNIKEQVLIIIKKQRVKEDILFVYNENVRLRSSIIKKIVDFYILYQEEDNFSKFITIDQIKVNEYNLSINKYFINEEIIIEDTSMLEKRLEIISSKNEANKKELLKLLNKY
jgi:type I restriction enzyme M protein